MNSRNTAAESATIHDLSVGDKVLWGDRSVPLTVTDIRSTQGVSDRTVVIVSNEVQSDGATYALVQEFTDGHRPKLRKEVTISPMYPNGYQPMGNAERLRKVVEN